MVNTMSAQKKRPAEAAAVDEDEAFPRGGSDYLTPLEKRQIAQEAQADFEAEEAEQLGLGPKRKRSKQEDGDQEGSFFRKQDQQGRVAKYVELLKFKNLSVGMKLWGMVLEVGPKGLIISLPHGLRGHVAPSEASDVLHSLLRPSSRAGSALRAALPGGSIPELPQLFAIGQYVRCAVLELKEGDQTLESGHQIQQQQQGKGKGKKGAKEAEAGKKAYKSVELSLRLKMVASGMGAEGVVAGVALPACVRTVEDHGYTLTFGIKGVTGFLRRKDHAATAAAPLLPGALIETVVTAAPDPRRVSVTVSPDAVSGAVTRDVAGVTLAGLLPGALVAAKVRGVLSDGLLVSFLTFFHGTVDQFHLASPIPEPNWRDQYAAGQKLRARILYVDPQAKRVGLSLLPHLINYRLPAGVPALGQVFEDSAIVRRVEPALGLLLELPLSPVPGAAFVHLSNITDEGERVEGLAKKYKSGQAVTARVIGFRLLDGLAVASLKESVIKQQIVSFKDVHIGQALSGTVVAVESYGLLVAITVNIKALVPTIHMSETSSKKMLSKFKVGSQVTGRVLDVDPSERHITLTLKKALLNSKLPPLSHISQAAVGSKVQGVVTGIQEYGAFVSFYGKLHGLAAAADLGLLPGQAPSDAFQIGQVVRARVLQVDRLKQRLKLSLAGKGKGADGATDAGDADGTEAAPADVLGGLQPGDVLAAPATVRKVEEAGEYLLDVTTPTGQVVSGRLLKAHLSDHPAAVGALADVLKAGMQLSGLMVLERLEHKGTLLLTRKASMVAAASSLPATFKEVTQSTNALPGYVANVTADAVYVRFLGTVTGRAGLAQLADVFVSEPARHFTVGQSVRAAIVQVDEEKQRFACTLKSSVVKPASAELLQGLFSDLAEARRLEDSVTQGTPVDLSIFTPGHATAAVVHEIKEYGLVCDLEAHPDMVGLVVPQHMGTAAAGDAAANGAAGNAASASGAEANGTGKKGSKGKGKGNGSTGGVAAAAGGSVGASAASAAASGHEGSVHAGPSGRFAAGQRLEGFILDVSLTDGIVDLSLKPELLAVGRRAEAEGQPNAKRRKQADGKEAAADQAQALKVGQKVDAVVQAVKEESHYLVVSLPNHHNALAVVPLIDYNSQQQPLSFALDERISAVVAALPSASTGDRLVLLAAASPGPKANDKWGGGKDGGRGERGGELLVKCVVTAVEPTGLQMQLDENTTARIHISEIPLQSTDASAALAASFKVGQTLTAARLKHVKGLHGHRVGQELSLRPELLKAASKPNASTSLPRITLDSLAPGATVTAYVQEVGPDSAWLSISSALRGRLHIFDSATTFEELTAFPTRFRVGQALQARVLRLDPKRHILDLTLRPDEPAAAAAAAAGPAAGATKTKKRKAAEAVADQAAAAGAASTSGRGAPAEGSLVFGRIHSVGGSGLLVQMGPYGAGHVALTDIHDHWVPNALVGIKQGAFVQARVVSVPAQPGGAASAAGSAKGRAASGDGDKLDKHRVHLSLRASDGGRVEGLEPPAAAAAASTAGKKAGKGKRGAAAAAAADAAPPAAGGTGDAAVPAPALLTKAQLAPGSEVRAYVRHASTRGVFVSLDRAHDALIRLRNLSDGFIEDVVAAFPVGAQVQGRVLSDRMAAAAMLGSGKGSKKGPADKQGKSADGGAGGGGEGRLELTLRSVVAPGEGERWLKYEDLKKGDVVTGKVRSIEKFGVFVLLDRSNITALAHISNCADEFVTDLAQMFSPKQAVTGRVMDIGPGHKVSLSLKASDVTGTGDAGRSKAVGAGDAGDDLDEEMLEAAAAGGLDSDDDAAAASDTDDEGAVALGSDDDGDEDQEGDIDDLDIDAADLASSDDEGPASDSEAVDTEDEEGEEEEEDEEQQQEEEEEEVLRGPDSLLDVGAAGPSGWGELRLEDDDTGAANGTGDASEHGKLSKREKKRLKQQHEAAIRQAELARLAGDAAPSTAAEFERLVVGSPNSSFVWIKYMAFLISLGETDKARAVAERALATIHYREEGEKFNVWVAWLNLENAYGLPTPEEALMSLFNRALQYNDQKKLYMALLGILERSERHELAADALRAMAKKFSGSCKVWVRSIEHSLTHGGEGGGTAARKALERGLALLPRRKHVKLISRAGLAEFRVGSAERGRSIFEGVLRNYPKRIDLWNVYIDQEVKLQRQGEPPERVRALFERATSLQLPPKKMKLLFRRWLEHEQAHGDAAAVEEVKRRAMEFVESAVK